MEDQGEEASEENIQEDSADQELPKDDIQEVEEDKQGETPEQQESDVNIIITDSQNDIYIDEGTHHQIYTREENEDDDDDDGVTVEEERDEQVEEQVAPGADDWLAEVMRNLEPALKVLNHSVFTPILQMVCYCSNI